MNATSRRKWLAATAAAGASATLNATTTMATDVDLSKLPYIDAHSHVWSPDVEKWPLAKGQTRADLKPLSFTPEELLKLAESEGVGRVVLIQHSVYHLFEDRKSVV